MMHNSIIWKRYQFLKFNSIKLFPYFIIYFISGIFFPLSTMPKWVTDVAGSTPVYHSVELSRGLVMGNLRWSMIEEAIWLLVFVILVFVYATQGIRKRIII
jgi:lipooligosaccharide transport system permease protein